MFTICILWQRFGPYHLARLAGAASVLGQNHRVLGLEVAGDDHYEWEVPPQQGDPERRTLFPDQKYADQSAKAIRQAVTRALNQIDPYAVAINGWAVPEAVAAARWCHRRGRRAILMSETFVPSGNAIKEWVKARRVRRFDAALVGGRWHAEYLEGLGFDRSRICIGYDAVDNDHFASVARPDSRPYFFANTRFLPRKNIDGLLRAYARYRGSCPKPTEAWPLVISGSGKMEPSWKALADELQISPAVEWRGFLQYEQLPTAYASAGAFVHVAHREAWGLVLNEAAAAGLPIIAGDIVGATCELLEDEKNGFLVGSKDDEAIANALAKIATLSKEQRQTMGERSKQIVADFSPRRFGEALLQSLQ